MSSGEAQRDLHPLCCGAVVVCRSAERPQRMYLVIRDRFGQWTLPKGHVEPGESCRDAARREILEETGVRPEVDGTLNEVCYRFWSGGFLVRKRVRYFLGFSQCDDLCPGLGEVHGACWVGEDDFLHYCDYDNNLEIYREALRRAKGGVLVDGQSRSI